jgi:DNA end-binding protein Ku
MPRQKAHKKKADKTAGGKSPRRAVWTGTIDFGLVTIPVKLHSAQAAGDQLDFDLLDKRDFNRIRYRRVNEKTGAEVNWDQIVKGYEYEKGRYVALSDEDFERANVEASQSIEITDFVDAADISPLYFDTPYYVEPLKNGRRAYALLRDVMKKTGKVAIAKVVLRTRQHLAALIPQDAVLVLETLRYPHELRDPGQLELPAGSGKESGTSSQEVKMAEQLIGTMTGKWDPAKYRDDYREDLLKLVESKIKAGKTKEVASAGESPRAKRPGKVIDIMHLLQQSVKQAQGKERPKRERKAG